LKLPKKKYADLACFLRCYKVTSYANKKEVIQVTDNPLLILIINMTVVFFVLFSLELLTRGIHLIDPTRKKSGPAAPQAVDSAMVQEVAGAETSGRENTIIAVIAAAIAAIGGTPGRISQIRRIDGASWTRQGRIEAVNVRKKMF